MPVHEHRKLSEGIAVRFCLVVTSDSVYRGERTDEVTPLVKSMLEGTRHRLQKSIVLPNRKGEIAEKIREWSSECDIILVTGGTGISRKDVSVDAITELCVKDLPGFGEIFRYLTYEKYGSAAIASRARACTVGDAIVFVTPGSVDAVEMALKELILPEAPHLVHELRKH